MLFCLATIGFGQISVTIDFQVGAMTFSDGTTPVPDGTLIQLIGASTIGGLTGPTSSSFISGTEVLIASGTVLGGTFVGPGSGTTDFAPGILSLPANEVLMLQWFPTLTSGASAPGANTYYGFYGAMNDGTWVVPSSGSLTGTFSFYTSSIGGSLSDSIGAATYHTAAAVPEPSTYAAIFGLFAVGVVCFRRKMTAL